MQDKILHIQEKYWNRQQGANAGTMGLLNSISRNGGNEKVQIQGPHSES